MRKLAPDKDYIRRLLSYDSGSGEFTWLESRGTIKRGGVAGGATTSKGRTYIQIKIDKSLYKAHHIAWFFIYGEWPSHDVDHIDGDGTNNRANNLRRCTHSQNIANAKMQHNNISGFKGVSWDKGHEQWRAYITHDRKRIWLGRFDKIEDAALVRLHAAKERFGEFARVA